MTQHPIAKTMIPGNPSAIGTEAALPTGAERLIAKLKENRVSIQRNIDKGRLRPLFIALAGVMGATAAGIIVEIAEPSAIKSVDFYEVALPFGFLVASLLYGLYLWYRQLFLRILLNNVDRQLALAGSEALQETIEEDFFTKLVKINFKYLDQYYLQTQAQADKSFTLSAAAAITALFIVISGIVMMFFDKVKPAYLTTASGVLGEFIAAVFFYLYNRTVIKMGEYHQKLVLTQNVSLALKIAEGMPEADRVKAQLGLVERLSQDVNMYLSSNESNPNRVNGV